MAATNAQKQNSGLFQMSCAAACVDCRLNRKEHHRPECTYLCLPASQTVNSNAKIRFATRTRYSLVISVTVMRCSRPNMYHLHIFHRFWPPTDASIFETSVCMCDHRVRSPNSRIHLPEYRRSGRMKMQLYWIALEIDGKSWARTSAAASITCVCVAAEPSNSIVTFCCPQSSVGASPMPCTVHRSQSIGQRAAANFGRRYFLTLDLELCLLFGVRDTQKL